VADEPTWDGDLYLTFATGRTRPPEDLVARLALDAPPRVADLGCGVADLDCGPGNSTVVVLSRRWSGAALTGVAHSETMFGTGCHERRSGTPGPQARAWASVWDNPTMVVTLDAKRRLTVPAALAPAKPGDYFDAHFDADEDTIVFRRIGGRESWLAVLKECPVSPDDVPPRRRAPARRRKL
jgi:hypothetical protein